MRTSGAMMCAISHEALVVARSELAFETPPGVGCRIGDAVPPGAS
jgi:hypothetical protein